MINFITLTLSITVAIILAGIITSVAIMAAMSNAKVVKWLTKYYMKQIEKSVNSFEDLEGEA